MHWIGENDDMTYDEFLVNWKDDSDSIVCHTSGSTGLPKSILLPKFEMVRSAQRTIDFFGINEHSQLYSCISPDFIGGKMMAVRAVVSGASFDYETPSNRPFRECFIPYIDLVSVVPSQMKYVLEHPKSIPDIGAFLVGGAPVSAEMAHNIVNRGLTAYETYGMTETASHIAIRQVSSNDVPFQLLPGISITTDVNDALIIDIKGWRRFHTNDVVRLVSNDQFYVLGRTDNVIISGGRKIHPEQVEHKLAPYLDFDFMITSVRDVLWGDKVVLVANIAPNQSVAKICKICKNVLEPYEVPKSMIYSPIVRTNNGKIDRIRGKYDNLPQILLG